MFRITGRKASEIKMKAYFRYAFCILVFSFWACEEEDRTITKLQYMPDMVDSPVAKAHRSYLDPPENSVAYNAMIYPKSIGEAEKFLLSPFRYSKNKDDLIKKGKKLYGTYCTPCHGLGAKGDGPITDKFPRPPNLIADKYRKKADGFFFYTITFGSESKLMPGQGHATDPAERWQIVMYLRDLQEADNES